MTASKSEGELLKELRTQLQETQAADFETNRDSMIALLDQMSALNFDRHFGTGNGTTLRAVENAFIKAIEQIIHDEPVKLDSSMTQEKKDQIFAQCRQEQAKEQEQRLDELAKEASPLHTGAVLHLFSRLEYIAGSVIRPLLALVRTVDPARIKAQCAWLPDSLVSNADRALKADKIAGGSKGRLSPEKQEAYRQDHADRLIRGGKNKTTFDIQMSHKYGRSPEVMARYRRHLESEQTLRN